MNNEQKALEKNFTDEKGYESTVVIEPIGSNYVSKFKEGKYKIVESIKSNKNKYLEKERKNKTFLTTDIGVHSTGFAPIATLATIIAVSILAMLYVMFRF